MQASRTEAGKARPCGGPPFLAIDHWANGGWRMVNGDRRFTPYSRTCTAFDCIAGHRRSALAFAEHQNKKPSQQKNHKRCQDN